MYEKLYFIGLLIPGRVCNSASCITFIEGTKYFTFMGNNYIHDTDFLNPLSPD